MTPRACCPVVELRQYTLHPGTRDVLIDLFDRELVETQEETGMTVIAQFRDVDRPDVFTWLRGFPDMPVRAASLGAFYGGPVWARHRDAANATMVTFDNVRLLRPIRAGAGFVLHDRPPPGASVVHSDLVVATIYTLAPGAAESFPAFFEAIVVPRLATSGARPIAMLETEPTPNNFPRLPVREGEGEHAFVWFAVFEDTAAYDRHTATLSEDTGMRAALQQHLVAAVEVWRLTPTGRSRPLG
jgi:hypothetical protein